MNSRFSERFFLKKIKLQEIRGRSLILISGLHNCVYMLIHMYIHICYTYVHTVSVKEKKNPSLVGNLEQVGKGSPD